MQKGPKIGILRLFRVFFETFLQTPKKTLFETFFAISGPEGPETRVNGGSGRKSSHSSGCCCVCLGKRHSSAFRQKMVSIPPPFSAVLLLLARLCKASRPVGGLGFQTCEDPAHAASACFDHHLSCALASFLFFFQWPYGSVGRLSFSILSLSLYISLSLSISHLSLSISLYLLSISLYLTLSDALWRSLTLSDILSVSVALVCIICLSTMTLHLHEAVPSSDCHSWGRNHWESGHWSKPRGLQHSPGQQ